ncbi:serine/threonine-protein kinase ppk30 isoform X2 [Belonocnema kinseyi]|uniref:serine/threonine-protein kinase ppk30 isoform X2 n=1 Tax=Belonocnema kinseyi TaxID=2817044 RepID=UPI00143E0036|nr:serine/threonine-protein kinase ppk30 isoform X2 [Belonocnema kinseyi]
MVVSEASIHNIMGGMESTGGVRLHNHKRKLKQRFDIIKKLGQGTYGKVQLGINKETGQEVAIKTIKKCKIETEADLVRIRREIQIMSSVQHPNIIHIYEVFENRDKMVLVMEYAAGGELYDYLSEKKVLTETEARRIFRQIISAVFYCHKHNICHRDLKLENILLDQIGNAKIADFGLSNVFDGQRLLNTFCGSPLYASPEIVKGTPYHGPEVDCWSLGVLLYTLVYGAMPFDGSNFKRLVKQISHSDYFEPQVPSPASSLIKDMLAVCSTKRSDIGKICTHWWVNEGYERNCLDIAEDLAAQTPVRLDLLLSLVPQSTHVDHLLVGENLADRDLTVNVSSEILIPARSYSVGDFLEFKSSSSYIDVSRMAEIKYKSTANGDAKRKLESTSSIDETVILGTKRKEISKINVGDYEQQVRVCESDSSNFSSKLTPITQDAMDIDSSNFATIPMDRKSYVETADNIYSMSELKKKPSVKKDMKVPVQLGIEKTLMENKSINNNKDCFCEQKNFFKEIPKSITKPSTLSSPKMANKSDVANAVDQNVTSDSSIKKTSKKLEDRGTTVGNNSSISSIKCVKKLRDKSHSLDSESLNEVPESLVKPVERRRSKIFETAEKFNLMGYSIENEKPKKIVIPGVNVGGTKRAFERKASLFSTTLPSSKVNNSNMVNHVSTDKTPQKNVHNVSNYVKLNNDESENKNSVDTINESIENNPINSCDSNSKLNLVLQVEHNDAKCVTPPVSTPTEKKCTSETKQDFQSKLTTETFESIKYDNALSEQAKKSSKMEITLKTATKINPTTLQGTEIILSDIKSPESLIFKTEVETKIDGTHPRRTQTQRSEVAFPINAAFPQINNSVSCRHKKEYSIDVHERILPILVDHKYERSEERRIAPISPVAQSSKQCNRQLTLESDVENRSKSTVRSEAIRKSPREYIIPISVEGGNYVTPQSRNTDLQYKDSTLNLSISRFGKTRRMSSLLSDASEDDESPFFSLSRDGDDILQRHMHRLRSSRPRRQASDMVDSLSSGEDDDDGFELLTAENLFSTLLSRVRSLTQRLNVEDNKNNVFPSSKLLGRLGNNSPQSFWSSHKPISGRTSKFEFKHTPSNNMDELSHKNSFEAESINAADNPEKKHEALFRGNIYNARSNSLPRGKLMAHLRPGIYLIPRTEALKWDH